VQARSDFHSLLRQHLDPTHLSRITRVADAHDIDAFPQLLHGPPRRIGRQRRDQGVLSREDFDRRIRNTLPSPGRLDDRDEVSFVRGTTGLNQRKGGTSNRSDPRERTDNGLNP